MNGRVYHTAEDANDLVILLDVADVAKAWLGIRRRPQGGDAEGRCVERCDRLHRLIGRGIHQSSRFWRLYAAGAMRFCALKVR